MLKIPNEYAWNNEIKCKRKGKKDLLALGDKNLAKISEENDKKSLVEPSQVGEREREREESLKSFEKATLKKSNLTFKKHDSRVSIDRKTASIDRNR